jgi:hypothetical protein
MMEIPGAETSTVLANFSDTTNSANGGAGYNPWTFIQMLDKDSIESILTCYPLRVTEVGVTALAR